jgi:predicted nucleic acid-binding protein
VILVDTSVWIDHLRKPEPRLMAALEAGQALIHPFVVGELACANLRNRVELLSLLLALPPAPVATDAEALGFIDRRELMGRGIYRVPRCSPARLGRTRRHRPALDAGQAPGGGCREIADKLCSVRLKWIKGTRLDIFAVEHIRPWPEWRLLKRNLLYTGISPMVKMTSSCQRKLASMGAFRCCIGHYTGPQLSLG